MGNNFVDGRGTRSGQQLHSMTSPKFETFAPISSSSTCQLGLQCPHMHCRLLERGDEGAHFGRHDDQDIELLV
jgi:hypothetical protein